MLGHINEGENEQETTSFDYSLVFLNRLFASHYPFAVQGSKYIFGFGNTCVGVHLDLLAVQILGETISIETKRSKKSIYSVSARNVWHYDPRE